MVGVMADWKDGTKAHTTVEVMVGTSVVVKAVLMVAELESGSVEK